MSYNRTTLKSRISDFINRVSPFNGDPLIQKSEDLTIRHDVLDNVVFKTPEVQSISAPSGTISANFSSNDQITINSIDSGVHSFAITISNLLGNQVGKISIRKSVGDVFSFTNATILPFNSTESQAGNEFISFDISVNNGSFFATQIYEPIYNVWETPLSGGTGGVTYDMSNCYMRRNRAGKVEFKGRIILTVTSAGPFNVLSYPAKFTPNTTRVIYGIDGLNLYFANTGLCNSGGASGGYTVFMDGVSYYL